VRCGDKRHCRSDALRQFDSTCPSGLRTWVYAEGHICYKRPCPPDCTGHAYRCPNRIGGGVVFRQRKGNGRLTLQCPAALLELLCEHCMRQAAERLRAGNSWTDHDLVFATRYGSAITRAEDWRTWKATLRQAQVRDAMVHAARHTAATLLIEQGVHIRVVQEVLGRTRVTTMERYTPRGHAPDEGLERADAPGTMGSGMTATATETATMGSKARLGPLSATWVGGR
jgi:integrase